MAGMVDLNASLSAAASNSTGVNNKFGDFIVGGRKPNPPWLAIALGALLLIGVVVYLVRK